MITVALLLTRAEMVREQPRRMQELGVKDALAVGCAHVLALIPGSSRSGSTIMAGLFASEMRETAARFSFLLSIPVIAGSGLLELFEDAHHRPLYWISTVGRRRDPERCARPLAVLTHNQ